MPAIMTRLRGQGTALPVTVIMIAAICGLLPAGREAHADESAPAPTGASGLPAADLPIADLPIADLPAAGAADLPAAGAADVIATVGSAVILRGDLDRVVRRTLTGMQGDLVTAERRHEIEATALEQLVDQRLLRNEIARQQIPVSAAELEAAIRKLQEQLTERGVAWDQFLERSGLDAEAVREQAALEIGLDKLLRPQLRDDRLGAVFQKRRRELDGTRMRVSHIVLRPDVGRGDVAVTEVIQKAAAIRGTILRSGLTFADAARRHSAGPSRFNGGDVGWITRHGQFFHEEFARQAFQLAKGEVSPPTVTPSGVHLIQVTAIEPGQGDLASVRQELTRLAAAEVLRETVTAARAATPIEYEAGIYHFDPATPPDGPAPRRVLVAGGGRP
jgi:parvulin-like peptidyl-prolyl isomerase